MRMYDIILKKRNGSALTKEEIEFLVKGITDYSIPDYQISAFAMAVFFQGMTDEETALLTDAMARSGDMVDLSAFGDLSVDKHSTGGVGDKTTLIVAPIAAAAGGKVAKMSGRGLGHTGGTVDKLESIPGYQVSLSPEDFIAQAKRVGLAVVGQSGNMAPADKRLYALRDVTATVDNSSLICSSIMSKKLAAGAHSIVLDVKVGSGAFMKTYEDAKKLSEEMTAIGKACGRNMAAVITDMDVPLGYAIGNALEVKEAIAVLKGELQGDIREVAVELSANMISLSLQKPYEEAKALANELIDSGKAYEKLKEWIAAQGGNAAAIEDTSLLPAAPFCKEVLSPYDGWITKMNTETVGISSMLLGAGREKQEDALDYGAGLIIRKKTGDKVAKGDVLVTLYASDKALFSKAEETYLAALTFGEEAPAPTPVIYDVIR